MKRININELDYFENEVIARDIYHNGQLLVVKGSVLSNEMIVRLKEIKDSFFNVFVKVSDFKCTSMDQIVEDALLEIVNQYIDDTFKKYSYTKENDIEIMKEIVKLFLDDIFSEEFFTNYLENLLLIDTRLFYHIVRVTILSMIMAVKANLPRKMIVEIGIGAIIHDIGKLKLFIEYPKLADYNHYYSFQEYELIKTHPVIGYKEIEKNSLIPIESRKIVLMHHVWENYDLSYSEKRRTHLSYPLYYENNMITKDNKDIAVSIVQTANYYDAMINNEHVKVNKLEVIKFIKANEEVIFGVQGAKLLYSHISMFGVGDSVYLSDGRIATVKEHTNNVKKPIVEIKDSNEIINLNESNIFIKNFVNSEGVEYEDVYERTKDYYYL